MEDPADVVRDALALVGLNNTGDVNTRHTTRFMNANSIESVEDFASLDTSQVREMVKIYRQAHAQGNMGVSSTGEPMVLSPLVTLAISSIIMCYKHS